MMSKEIELSPKAFSDLEEIKNYISIDLSNPSAAKRTVKGILDSVSDIKEQPDSGTPLYFDDDLFSGYRYVADKKYMAFYRIANDAIFIDRVVYARRDYMRILFPNKNSDKLEILDEK